MIQFPLGQWTPDQPGLDGPGVQDVQNVFPMTTISYSPIAAPLEQGTALGARSQGAATFRGVGGSIVNFAGDATKLYSYNGTTWSDVTRSSGGAYSVAVDDGWSFTQYGDFVVAQNGTDVFQVFEIGADTEFSDLTGSPPIGRFGMVVGPHFITAKTAAAQNKVAWAGFTGLTSWVPGIDLSDEQELFIGGKIMGCIGSSAGGKTGVVFSENAIHLMNYIGADPVFDIVPVSEDLGAAVEGSIAGQQQSIIFLSWDGFRMLQGGQELVKIGKQRVDTTFWNTVNQSFLYRCCSAFDPIRNLYCISFPSTASTDGVPDTTWFYSPSADRWSKGVFGFETLFSLRSQTGYNTDTVDAVITNTDFTSFSVDTSLFSGSGRAALAGFSMNHKLQTFSGPSLEALVETQELQITPGRKTKVMGLDPLCDGGSLSVSLGYRDRPNDALTWTGYSAQNTIGFCPFRNEARYHRARLKVAAGGTYNHIQGLNPRATPGAMR